MREHEKVVRQDRLHWALSRKAVSSRRARNPMAHMQTRSVGSAVKTFWILLFLVAAGVENV